MEWMVLLFRMPAEPSRHRVAVWRELRRTGAVSVGQSVWLAPSAPAFADGMTRAVRLVQAAGGDAIVLDAGGHQPADAERLAEVYTAAREAEWTEFLAECGRYLVEIEGDRQEQADPGRAGRGGTKPGAAASLAPGAAPTRRARRPFGRRRRPAPQRMRGQAGALHPTGLPGRRRPMTPEPRAIHQGAFLAVEAVTLRASMVKMGSPVRFRRGAPHQISSSSRVQHLACRVVKRRQPRLPESLLGFVHGRSRWMQRDPGLRLGRSRSLGGGDAASDVPLVTSHLLAETHPSHGLSGCRAMQGR
jgi:hypothetical protein